MKKINVVKSNEEFNNVIKSGKVLKNRYFVIYYLDNQLNRYRFGISVGKKVCNAVNRNRLKRQVRNIVDNCKNYYQNSRDYIIIVRKSCLNESYNIMRDSLINLFEKIEKESKNEKK